MKLDELWEVVRQIPKGKVMSYGAVGELLSARASGRSVGRWMAQCPEDVPWWRVVAKTGQLPISKRGPGFASEQEERLRKERVQFLDSCVVDMERHSIDEV